MNVTKTRIVKVVGVTFTRAYPNNILLLHDINNAAENAGERLRVVLVRNPANEHDSNAIEVHIPALGDMAMIGHIARDGAARLAPRLDAGERFICEVAWCRIDPKHPSNPGIDIAIARVLDTGQVAA